MKKAAASEHGKKSASAQKVFSSEAEAAKESCEAAIQCCNDDDGLATFC
jgi:hypothetical protein